MVGMVSIKYWTGSQQSLNGLWGKCGRSAISQWALNSLTSLSVISQQSANKRNSFGELSWSFIDLRWSQLHGLSEICWSFRDLSWSLREHCSLLITQWAFNELSMVAVGLSMNAQRSPWSLRGLRWSPWNLLDIDFLLLQWVFPLRQLFWGSWRLLRDLVNFGLSTVFPNGLRPVERGPN